MLEEEHARWVGEVRARLEALDPDTRKWLRRVAAKRECLGAGKGGVYMYHSRKAAGTTLRVALQAAAKSLKVPFWETEGISLPDEVGEFLVTKGVLTATTLRPPIERVMSLYWYEHVAWWNRPMGNMKVVPTELPKQTRNLSSWIDTWRDDAGGGVLVQPKMADSLSSFKTKYVWKNPFTVYVEVENYYVKWLSGWKGPGQVGEADWEKAKNRLLEFDVVLFSTDLRDPASLRLVGESLGNPKLVPDHVPERLKQDDSMKQRLQRLVVDQKDLRTGENITSTLAAISAWDVKLMSFARSMTDARLSAASFLPNLSSLDMGGEASECYAGGVRLPPQLQKSIGLFQPDGHKE